MKILVIGSGGREHALAWKLGEHASVVVAPGNGGTADVAQNVDLKVDDHEAVARFARENAVDLVVVGPEVPLVGGLADTLRAAGITTFGPSAGAAQLEGSKHFTKTICDARNVPTARYAQFNNLPAARRYVRAQGAPIVVKADGLAAGKGVTVAETVAEAFDALEAVFDEPGASVVVEECLQGVEASMFFLCDGTTALPFGSAQDHKRAFDGDAGPNTGGMGAFSPSPHVTPDVEAEVLARFIEPTLAEMAARGVPFVGVLYAGLMLTDEGPKLIEYNVRFGDPECQALMLRFDGNLADLLLAAATGDLTGRSVRWSERCSVCVVLASKGYPNAHEAGTAILGLPADTETVTFHAGTKRSGTGLLAVGGRVLNVCATGTDVEEARERAYRAVRQVDWPGGFHRTDIGSSS